MLKIGEFAKKTGVSIRTLRYYDEINLFRPAEIDLFTGYRYYCDEQIKDLEIINKLKSLGFTLEEIRDNWNNFTDILMLDKKNELLSEMKKLDANIKEIDNLRSKIVNGRFMLDKSTERERTRSRF